MAEHYDAEREADLEKRRAKGRRKPKISRKGEIVFLLSLAFIVGSLIILY